MIKKYFRTIDINYFHKQEEQIKPAQTITTAENGDFQDDESGHESDGIREHDEEIEAENSETHEESSQEQEGDFEVTPRRVLFDLTNQNNAPKSGSQGISVTRQDGSKSFMPAIWQRNVDRSLSSLKKDIQKLAKSSNNGSHSPPDGETDQHL